MNDSNKFLEEAVLGKLAAEGLSIDSSWDKIEKCLSRIIAKTKCIKVARYLKYEKKKKGKKYEQNSFNPDSEFQ